jgi:hypothetical protein
MKFVLINTFEDYYLIMAPDGETGCVDKETYENLVNLTSQRDYLNYLNNIGQN